MSNDRKEDRNDPVLGEKSPENITKKSSENKIKVPLKFNPLSSSYDAVASTLFNTDSESRVLTPSRASVNFFAPDFSLRDNIETQKRK